MSDNPVQAKALSAEELADKIARAIWWSYWPDQGEQWIREHWECNARVGTDHDPAQRVPRILADVVMEVVAPLMAERDERIAAVERLCNETEVSFRMVDERMEPWACLTVEDVRSALKGKP